MTSKRYGPEIKSRGGFRRKDRPTSWEREVMIKVEELGLPEVENDCLTCMICGRQRADVVPRQIIGLENPRFRSFIRPQLECCADCSQDIVLGRVDVGSLFGGQFVRTGEIGVRVMGRAKDEADEKPDSLQIGLRKAAVPVDSGSVAYRLKKMLGN